MLPQLPLLASTGTRCRGTDPSSSCRSTGTAVAVATVAVVTLELTAVAVAAVTVELTVGTVEVTSPISVRLFLSEGTFGGVVKVFAAETFAVLGYFLAFTSAVFMGVDCNVSSAVLGPSKGVFNAFVTAGGDLLVLGLLPTGIASAFSSESRSLLGPGADLRFMMGGTLGVDVLAGVDVLSASRDLKNIAQQTAI